MSSGWRGPVGAAPYFGGINQFGSQFAGMILDAFASGTGANANRDGVDTGGNMMNPSSMITDAEMIEMNLPFLFPVFIHAPNHTITDLRAPDLIERINIEIL